ncbi:hypothetical protein AB0J86_30715 [Micromonospora sp. NPDC049559]|uniref:hypothetical protein n=1 Tax=Micromonospora sp. NPDC049559 TaxID=3155923 RepID=UPI00342FB03B
MKKTKPVVLQVYCRVEVTVDDPDAVLERAAQRLGEADIDWSQESDTLDEAVAELRGDLVQAVASLVDPVGLLTDVPGAEMRNGRCWAEVGAPSERFQPGFGSSAPGAADES